MVSPQSKMTLTFSSSLNHPSIVRLYGVFVSQYNENMMVFEYLPEGSLLSMVKQQRAQLTKFDLLKM